MAMIEDTEVDLSFMKQSEKEFWEEVEAKICTVDHTVKVLLSANGFRNYFSFKGVEVNEELLAQMGERIRKLGKETNYYKAVENLTQESPEEFEFCVGFKISIKNLFQLINEKSNFPLKSKLSDSKKQSVKRGVSQVEDASTSNRNKKQAREKQPEEHELKIREKITNLITICNPSIDVDNIQFNLEQVQTTENSVAFSTLCFLCQDPLKISVVINNNYVKYRFDTYIKHIQRKHKDAAKRLQDLKEFFGIFEDNEEILETINLKLRSIPDFRNKLNYFLTSLDKDPKDENTMFAYLMNECVVYFERNSPKNRFNDQLRKFCEYIYLKGGLNCYTNIYFNSPIPAPSTLKNNLQADRMETSKLYTEELLFFLKKYDCPLEVVVSEDATRLSNRIEYDPSTNELYGLLANIDPVSGMPIPNFFKASKPSKVLEYMQDYKAAPYIQAIVAKPFKLGTPSMVLGTFATNNAYTSTDVVNRWKYIYDKLKSVGIKARFSSDGDPRLLGAMKALTNFGTKVSINELNISVMCDLDSSIKCMQDSIHLANKLKNRLYDTANDLITGNYFATVNHLKLLVQEEKLSRNDHMLTYSDVNASDKTHDKMNFGSTKKICTENVISLLQQHVEKSDGTVFYLKIIQSVIKAYVDEKTPLRLRLYSAFFGVSCVRRWKNNVKKGSNDNFVTTNVWTSMELNFAALLNLILNGQGNLVIVWNSQVCEELFRTLRSLTTSGLTEINFTLLEALEKMNRVKKIQQLAFDLREDFELSENIKMKSDTSSYSNISSAHLSIDECREVLEEASNDAKNACELLGMKNTAEADPKTYLKRTKVSTLPNSSVQNEESDDELSVANVQNYSFIDETSDSNVFKMCDENGNFIKEMKKSHFLWLLEDEKHKVSTDRMQRFKEGRKEQQVEKVKSNEKFFKDKVLDIGDFICMKDLSGKNLCIIGKIINFRYTEKTQKNEKRFPHKNLIVEGNKIVGIKLIPSYVITKTRKIMMFSCEYIKLSHYVCSVNKNVIDFTKSISAVNYALLEEKINLS